MREDLGEGFQGFGLGFVFCDLQRQRDGTRVREMGGFSARVEGNGQGRYGFVVMGFSNFQYSFTLFNLQNQITYGIYNMQSVSF